MNYIRQNAIKYLLSFLILAGLIVLGFLFGEKDWLYILALVILVIVVKSQKMDFSIFLLTSLLGFFLAALFINMTDIANALSIASFVMFVFSIIYGLLTSRQ